MENQKEIIENTLKEEGQEIAFEPIPDEAQSPLAEPVIEREAKEPLTESPDAKMPEPPKDAPEQTIDEKREDEPKKEDKGQDFNIPLETAGLLADSILGTVNNLVLELGGGFFVKIKKHKEFYDFDELIQVIDEQNVKNIERIKLDEEDKALLRPLLIQILRKKAKVLTPEEQLIMVSLSILIKKSKLVVEIRSENEILVDRIRDIIRTEIGSAIKTKPDPGSQENEPSEEEMIVDATTPNTTGLPDEALEIL
jgi:hypothetical protein